MKNIDTTKIPKITVVIDVVSAILIVAFPIIGIAGIISLFMIYLSLDKFKDREIIKFQRHQTNSKIVIIIGYIMQILVYLILFVKNSMSIMK